MSVYRLAFNTRRPQRTPQNTGGHGRRKLECENTFRQFRLSLWSHDLISSWSSRPNGPMCPWHPASTATAHPLLDFAGFFFRLLHIDLHCDFWTQHSNKTKHAFTTTVWVEKSLPWNCLTFFSKQLEIFSPNFARLLRVPIYAGLKYLSNYLQLWRSYAIISATTMCSKCPPSTETHAGWSHLIWHNFVRVADNWIKIRILA